MSYHHPSTYRVWPSFLWMLSIGGLYLLLWKSVNHWSGKWTAPYWFAVGLGVLLAYGLLMRGLKHLVWVIPFACIAVCARWFLDLGIYQHWGKTWLVRWWSHLDDWEQTLPTLILMAIFVIFLLFMRAADKGWRFHFSYALFLSTMLIVSMFRDIICSIYLPPDGSFGGFDHDIAGFRLGGYYLFTVAVSVSLLKFVSSKLRVIAPHIMIGGNLNSPFSRQPK